MKSPQSEKYKILVVSTLDYLISHYTGEFVYDGFDPVKQYHEEQKVQAEKYRKQGQLKRLQQQLEKFINRLQWNFDLGFPDYIKERTGYELNIFRDLENFGDEVLLRGEIQDEIESRKLSNLLALHKRVNMDEEKHLQLTNILSDFYKRAANQQKRDRGISRVIKTEEKDGIIMETIEISFGPKPKHSQMQEILSPDEKRRLIVSEWMDRDETQATTSVSISFKTAGGGIYAVEGIHPDIKAFWKNNNTVVIETSKDYSVLAQHRLIQSFEDIVNVEYKERE